MVNGFNMDITRLSIFFPWDDDLYCHMKEGGLGRGYTKVRPLPLISAEDTESTLGSRGTRRRNVIMPELFGESLERLGWEGGVPFDMPFVASERPILGLEQSEHEISLKIITAAAGKEQYHLEHEPRGGSRVKNVDWVMIYLMVPEFYKVASLVRGLGMYGERSKNQCFEVKREYKENEGELLYYVELPLLSYEFSLGGFRHAASYLENSGYRGSIPSISYDSKSMHSDGRISPIAKVGFAKSKNDPGFEDSQIRFAIKLAQPKESLSKRGKKAKLRGVLADSSGENKMVFDRHAFCPAILALGKFLEGNRGH